MSKNEENVKKSHILTPDKEERLLFKYLEKEAPDGDRHCYVRMGIIEFYVPAHWHDFFEIELILDGTGTQILNGREYRISRGSLYFINPSDVHSISCDGPVKTFHLSFDEKFLSDDMRRKFQSLYRGSVFMLAEDDLSELEKLTDLMYCEYTKNRPCSEDMLSLYFECLATYLIRLQGEVHEVGSTALLPSETERLLMYLKLHFRESPSLSEAAEIVGLSPNYFSSKFREVMGENYISYLNGIKLDYAKVLISRGSLPISDICYASGFSTMSNFLKLFMRRFGMTPTDMRKLTKEKSTQKQI